MTEPEDVSCGIISAPAACWDLYPLAVFAERAAVWGVWRFWHGWIGDATRRHGRRFADGPISNRNFGARARRGELGIAFVRRRRSSITFERRRAAARESAAAYQAFWFQTQADWVHIDHLGEYPLVYLPFVMHKQSTGNHPLCGARRALG